MTVLPTPGADDSTWGTMLNTWLTVSMNADGTLNPSAVTPAVNGYLQIPFTYNGSSTFIADCLVGENYTPSNGGFLFGQFPIEPFFGPQDSSSPQTFPATAYIDGSGVVQTFMYMIAGMGGDIECFDNAGNPVPINISFPTLNSVNGISISDNSDTGISIRENGGGTLDIFSQGEMNITSESLFILNVAGMNAGLGGPTQIIVDSGNSGWPLTIGNQNTGGINIFAEGGGIGLTNAGNVGIDIVDEGGDGITIGEEDPTATNGVAIINSANSTSILIGTSNQNPVQITTDAGDTYANLYNSDTVADLPNPPTAQPAFGFSGQGTFNWYDGTQWRAPVGVTQLRSFNFDYTTPNLNTGVALYTPQSGEVLLDAWIQTSVWDGTTPTADFGMLLTPNEGLLAVLTTLSSSNRLQDMTVGQVTQYGLTYDDGTANNLANASSWADVALVPSFFSSTDPFCVVVSTDGTVSGGATGSTMGTAVLFLLTAIPSN